MTPMERTEHHLGPFWVKDFGAISAAPSSPGPFVLLLKNVWPVGHGEVRVYRGTGVSRGVGGRGGGPKVRGVG